MATVAEHDGYEPRDLERFLPETHSGNRSDFARDRARVLHSSGWRRLSAKTQVISPTAGVDFARNRLTHSLEVAQIGRELAASLGVSQDVVDTACLAHDLGHPPFGHNGERALSEWMAGFGGFEGNAQTLRILTRLEPKRFSADGTSVGLNLTRATLDASCKYPWSLAEASAGSVSGGAKFGYFEVDAPVFEWLRAGAPDRRKCVEAQIMDLSDDIAYSVHDFEDAIARVNDSDFGLQAGVFTARLDHAMRAWQALEVGGVIVGDVPSFRVDHMPYGGVKDSGLGREGVRWAIADMTEERLLVLREPGT